MRHRARSPARGRRAAAGTCRNDWSDTCTARACAPMASAGVRSSLPHTLALARRPRLRELETLKTDRQIRAFAGLNLKPDPPGVLELAPRDADLGTVAPRD